MPVPLPTAESLARRARLASLVSAIKPRRFRTSIYSLPAHRIPTLWSLYRSLLRDAPSEHIRWRIGVIFRRDKGLRLAGEVQKSLERSHRWLEIFTKAKQGDQHTQAILERYTRMIATKRDMAKWEQLIRDDMAWRAKLRNRPILTGAYLRPTLYNGPLPQMRPLPDHVSKMINSRRRARERRQALFARLFTWQDDLRRERDFETTLAAQAERAGVQVAPVFRQDYASWDFPLQHTMNAIVDGYRRETERLTTPYPPAMLAQIKEARREKLRNKTRERERERRGVVLRRTEERRRRGMPAHVLAQATPRQRHAFEVTKGVSEVGYVGQLKRERGFKLRDPEAWKAELGRPEDQERLEQMTAEISAENERRRARELEA
ncbi:hypothetical protein B0H21DRAFT_205348 [Amylocystis lapponica]|nr:hypothetical protein B0H21DRAFT_205348 [Amylocystis lapponica]